MYLILGLTEFASQTLMGKVITGMGQSLPKMQIFIFPFLLR